MPYPGFIPPALATDASKPPAGAQWVHEVKFDGYRIQLHIYAETIKVFTRRGYDWTSRFEKIAADAWHLNAKSAIIDGEVIVPGADGLSDFGSLQRSFAANGHRRSSSCMRSICSTSTVTTCGASPWSSARSDCSA